MEVLAVVDFSTMYVILEEVEKH